MLADRGWLLLGHAETLWQVSDDFALAPVGDAFAYRKEARRPAALGAVPAPEITPAVAAQPTAAPVAAAASAGSSPRASGGAGRRGAPRPGARSPPTRRPPTPPTEPGGPGAAPVAAPPVAVAREALADGRYAAAAELAAAAIDADPLDPDAYVVRGQALSTLGDDDGGARAAAQGALPRPGGRPRPLPAGRARSTGWAIGPRAVKAFRAAAETLPRVPPAVLQPLLDGRPVAELVALCRQLGAEGLDGRAT